MRAPVKAGSDPSSLDAVGEETESRWLREGAQKRRRSGKNSTDGLGWVDVEGSLWWMWSKQDLENLGLIGWVQAQGLVSSGPKRKG